MRSPQSRTILTIFLAAAIAGTTGAREFREQPGGMPVPGADSTSVVRTYVPDGSDFTNPERGFYKSFAPFFLNTQRQPLRNSGLTTLRAQGITVIRAYYVIDEFLAGPLSPVFLAAATDDLAAVREAGLKIIPRFAYNFPCAGSLEPCVVENAIDAPLDRVLGHIDQLRSVLQANADVIAFIETGFIGAWGEWHHSSNLLLDSNGRVNANTTVLIDRLLDALPSRRMSALRYPYHKQALAGAAPLTAAEAFSGSARARLGAHNDCVFADRNAGGTYSLPYPPFTQDPDGFKQFLNADNRFLPQGGETCSEAPEAQPYIQCANALVELAQVRWSTINLDYQPNVIQLWRNQGCFAEISRRLGYRFRLIEADLPTTAAIGGSFNARLSIANDGFAAPYNPRAFELVLRRRTDGRLYRLPINADPRFWTAGATTSVPLAITVPPTIEAGAYSLLLALPDPEATLYARPEYSIRLANANLWEPATGFNDLESDLVVVANPPPLNLSASIAGNQVTLGWTPPPAAPDGYLLEGGVDAGAVLASLPIPAGVSTFTLSVPTGAFYIRLHALRSSTRSAASNEVRIFVNVPPPPAPPANLLGLVNGSALQLAWRNPPGPAPTSIALDVSGAIATSIVLPVADSFAFAGVPAGTYAHAVRAVNAAGSSAPSNAVTLTFPGPCSGIPAAPPAPAVSKSGNAVTVSWDPPATGSAPSQYTLVVHGTFEGQVPTTGRTLAGTVAPGTYVLSVKASNACGSSAESPAATVTVP
jgi:hypothetical protein